MMDSETSVEKSASADSPWLVSADQFVVLRQRPEPVGRYVLGNNELSHHFSLTRKPSRIERFFVRRLLGLTWVDAA